MRKWQQQKKNSRFPFKCAAQRIVFFSVHSMFFLFIFIVARDARRHIRGKQIKKFNKRNKRSLTTNNDIVPVPHQEPYLFVLHTISVYIYRYFDLTFIPNRKIKCVFVKITRCSPVGLFAQTDWFQYENYLIARYFFSFVVFILLLPCCLSFAVLWQRCEFRAEWTTAVLFVYCRQTYVSV